MGKRLFGILLALAGAVAGAFAGRYVARMRQQRLEAEYVTAEAPAQPAQPPLRPRDVVPGLIAALRVHDRPWSYLHIPGWMAAFAVNFGLGAMGRDFGPLGGSLPGGWDWGRPRTRWTEARVVSEPTDSTDSFT